MKIRNPWLIKVLGFAASWLVRAWISTLAFRYRPIGPNMTPKLLKSRQKYIYVFWHENILLPCYEYRGRDIKVLISTHADGQLIAEVCRHIGFDMIRGSSTRGGAQAMREMMRSSQDHHIAIMPDGPRGPRRRVEMGIIYLASKTGMPLVLMGMGFDRPWRLNTWDRFVLPRPGSKAMLLTLPPIPVPAKASKPQLEALRLDIEQKLNDLTDYAEYLATGGPAAGKNYAKATAP